jgi:hypothetical protein
MKRLDRIVATAILIILIPYSFVSGQDKKTEQRIKVVVAEDGGSKVVIDTLITGNEPKDSIIVKGGKTIYLSRAVNNEPDLAHGSGNYVITTTVTDKGRQAHCVQLASGENFTYTITSDDKATDSEKAKYVISRDGIRITVEGSDYDKVKDVIKDIEKTLDNRNQAK